MCLRTSADESPLFFQNQFDLGTETRSFCTQQENTMSEIFFVAFVFFVAGYCIGCVDRQLKFRRASGMDIRPGDELVDIEKDYEEVR